MVRWQIRYFWLKPTLTLILLSLWPVGVPLVYAEGRAVGSSFAADQMIHWQGKSFSGTTRYSLQPLGEGEVIHAVADGSASGLFFETRIDLTQTPILRWSWRAGSHLLGLNEQSKQGDDYVARIYVVAKHPYLFWKSRVLNYVWSSNQPQGSSWPNAYTHRAVMVAVAGQKAEVGEWRSEHRDVQADFLRYFGEQVDQLDLIAIMSDTDNSGGMAEADYGTISFMQQ